MKFKEKNSNVFVFDGGYADDELVLFEGKDDWFTLVGTGLDIREDLSIRHESDGYAYYRDIQTAVNLMQILIKEGLV